MPECHAPPNGTCVALDTSPDSIFEVRLHYCADMHVQAGSDHMITLNFSAAASQALSHAMSLWFRMRCCHLRTSSSNVKSCHAEVVCMLHRSLSTQVDNLMLHEVMNTAAEPRVHLIADVAERPMPERKLLKPGQVCKYASNMRDVADSDC